MQLEITDNTVLKDIQHTFNRFYLYLWIDFYISVPGPADRRLEKISPQTPLGNLCKVNGMNYINVNGKRTVAELEKDFWEMLGLDVKVLRKSGNVWVGTVYTRSWTLDNQNDEGEQIKLD